MSTVSFAALGRLRPASAPSDRQLLESYAVANDQGAFAALVQRHGKMVLGLCRRVLGNAEDAEDAFQAAFLVLATRGNSIRRTESLTSWLYGVAYRLCLRAKRDAGRRRKYESRVEPRSNPPAWEVGWRELQGVLDEEVQHLPPADRAAFVLCCLEGLSKAEAAERIGIKANTVSSQLARARKRLQQRLARRGISLSAGLAALTVAGAGKAALPPRLVRTMGEAASRLRVGARVTGLSARVLSLAEGVTTMPTSKLKMLTVLLCALGLGLSLFARETRNARDPLPSRALRASLAQADPSAGKSADEAIEVKVRVLGPEGRPVAGARVYQAIREESHGAGSLPTPKQRGKSDRAGRCRLRVARSDWAEDPKALLQIIAVAPGFGPGWVELEKVPDREVSLRLVKDDVPITGRILDLQGRPIRGATIRPEVLLAAPEESLTPWLQAIRARKRCNPQEFLSKELMGEPVPGFPALLKTDAEGRFRLTGVGRERALGVVIGGPGLVAEEVILLTRRTPRFEVFDNATTDDKLIVYGASVQHFAAPSKPLSGVVRAKDTGKPLAGVKVGTEDPFHQVVTDKEGKFLLDSPFDPRNDGFGVPLLAIPSRDQPYLVGFKEVKRGRGLEPLRVDFHLKRGVWVEGKVTNKATGKPVRARIEYSPAADNPHRKDAADFSRFLFLAREIYSTGPDGKFRIPVLPGRGSILAHGPANKYLAAGAVTINVPGEGKPIPCPIFLDPGRTLTGTIQGPDGKPVSGVHVFNMNPQHFWTSRPLTTAAFTLTAVDPRGRRSLIFLHQQKRWVKALELEGKEANPLTVRLEPAGTLTGRLVEEDGTARPGVKLLVYFVSKDRDYVAEHFAGPITTDRAGRFSIEGVAPGVVYQINLAGKSNRNIGSVASRLTVKSGETKDLGDVKGKLFTD